MPDVCGRYHDVVTFISQRSSLRCQDDVGVKRCIVRSRLTLLAAVCPKLGREKHTFRGDREIVNAILQLIQALQTEDLLGPQQFAPHFIIRDFRNYDPYTPSI